LTLNAVPRPPAGLAERIKADIPKYLEADPNPSRFTRTWNFHLRIAASILLVTTSVVVAMMVMQRNPEQQLAAKAGRPVIFAPAARAVPTTDTTNTVQVARTEELHLDIIQESPEVPRLADTRVAPPAEIAPSRQLARNEDAPRAQERDAESGVEGSYGDEAGVAGGRVAGEFEETQQPAQAQVGHVRAVNIGSGYGWKTWTTLEL